MDAFRNWLKDQIQNRDLSVRAVANGTGLSDVALLYIMSGRTHSVKPETVRKLAAYFHYDEDALLELAGIRSPKEQREEVDLITKIEMNLRTDPQLAPSDVDFLLRSYKALRNLGDQATEHATAGSASS